MTGRKQSRLPALSRFLWRVLPPLVRGAGRMIFSLQVEREADLPPPPFVIASNHYSHFDAVAIGAVLGAPVRYLALEDLFGVSRVLDWLVTAFGAIPTPRHRVPVGAMRHALAALEDGEVVGLFPEATRVSHWGTLPAKRGAAWLAVRVGVPLVPVAVVGTGRVFGLENELRRGSIRVVIGKPLQSRGTEPAELTERWSEWISAQIARHPDSEVSGPRRAYHSG